jgi:hypothetical protein
MKLAFFLGENATLRGKSPLEALRKGRPQESLQSAELYGQHGAV